MLALDARVVLRSLSGARELSVEDYVLAPYVNTRDPTELLTEVRIPLADGPMRAGFFEVARKHSDFALALAAAVVSVEDGVCLAVRLAVGGADTNARRCRAAEERLLGRALTPDLIRDAARVAAADLDAFDTPHGSRDYKRQVYGVQAARALGRAAWTELGVAA
jgi:CO/xanthine dehydrogenase FAD-binding subunit